MAFLTTALAKNLLVLFALLLGVILLFLYLGLFPATSTPVPVLDPLHIAAFNFTAAAPASSIPQLADAALSHTTLYRADNTSATSNWTYSHYPVLYVVNGSSSLLLVAWSSAPQDEDSDGERILYSAVTTSTPPNSTRAITNVTMPHTELFPSALLAGQPAARLYNGSTLVRAMCPDAFVQVADGSLYAVAELYGSSDVTGMPYEGVGFKGTGYGRVARPLSNVDGSIVGDVCWLEPSKYARALDATPYTTFPSFTYCLDTAELLALLADPTIQPPWSWALESDNHPVIAADGSGGLGEPTHAVPVANNELCRFWRSFGEPAPLNHTLYIECTNSTGSTVGWFNGTHDTQHRGGYNFTSIVATNVPDANSKAFLGAFPETSGSARSAYRSFHSPANLTHYLVSNTVPTADGLLAYRSPLTIATSVDNGLTFNGLAALQSAHTALRYPGRLKNNGYQYPAAVVRPAGPRVNGSSVDVLFVVYSVNKEDIMLTSVWVGDLPRNVTGLEGPAGGSDSFGKGFVFFVLCVAAVVLIGAAAYWVIQRSRQGELLDDEKWHPKKAPLVNGKHALVAEEDEYEEYEDEEDEDDEDGEYEEHVVEEHKQPAANNGYVTSTDVARMVTSQPTASKVKRPVQIA